MTYPDGTQHRNTPTPDGYIASVQQLSGTTWNTVATNTWDADGLLTQQQPTDNAATHLDPQRGDWAHVAVPGHPVHDRSRPSAGHRADLRHLGRSPRVHDRPGHLDHHRGHPLHLRQGKPGPRSRPQCRSRAQRTYDKLGRRTSLATVNGKAPCSTTYQYDAASQLTKRTVRRHGPRVHLYDAGLSTGESWTVPSGTAAGDYSVAWTWGYYSRALEGETYAEPAGRPRHQAPGALGRDSSSTPSTTAPASPAPTRPPPQPPPRPSTSDGTRLARLTWQRGRDRRRPLRRRSPGGRPPRPPRPPAPPRCMEAPTSSARTAARSTRRPAPQGP